jgi:hypothetical protein
MTCQSSKDLNNLQFILPSILEILLIISLYNLTKFLPILVFIPIDIYLNRAKNAAGSTSGTSISFLFSARPP